jgi:hypothetical protein
LRREVAYISLSQKSGKPPQLFRSIVHTKIKALVTPLEKPSPRGDTGNEPVFSLRLLKVVKPVSSAKETTVIGRYQSGTPQDTSAKNFVPNPDLTHYI